MATEAQRRANAKWDKENSRSYGLKCVVKTDSDIIEFLDSLDNRSIFLKQLIRSYIKSQETTKGE